MMAVEKNMRRLLKPNFERGPAKVLTQEENIFYLLCNNNIRLISYVEIKNIVLFYLCINNKLKERGAWAPKQLPWVRYWQNNSFGCPIPDSRVSWPSHPQREQIYGNHEIIGSWSFYGPLLDITTDELGQKL